MDFVPNMCAGIFGYNGEKILKSINRNKRYCKK